MQELLQKPTNCSLRRHNYECRVHGLQAIKITQPNGLWRITYCPQCEREQAVRVREPKKIPMFREIKL